MNAVIEEVDRKTLIALHRSLKDALDEMTPKMQVFWEVQDIDRQIMEMEYSGNWRADFKQARRIPDYPERGWEFFDWAANNQERYETLKWETNTARKLQHYKAVYRVSFYHWLKISRWLRENCSLKILALERHRHVYFGARDVYPFIALQMWIEGGGLNEDDD